MKITVKIEKEVEVKYLYVEAGVRYWEDATVNGVEDTDGTLIPCRKQDCWCPIIDINTGQVINWQEGTTAKIHYKVCDSGSYWLEDEADNEVAKIENDYVPSLLSPKENGYGDYIIMDIDENGFIQDWKPNIKAFTKDND